MSTESGVGAPSESASRLQGRWLLLTRVAWFCILALTISLLVFSIPVRIERLLRPCDRPGCDPALLTSTEMHALEQTGSVSLYVGYQVALSTAFVLVFCAAATLIFRRKSDTWIGLYVSTMLLIYSLAASSSVEYLRVAYPALETPAMLLTVVGGIMLGVFFYLFPDGRFVPRWTVWLVPLVVVREFANAYLRDSPVPTVLLFAVLATWLYAQVYRYRRVSSLVQRQQTKWFVYGTVIALVGVVTVLALSDFLSPQAEYASILAGPVVETVFYLLILLLPLTLMAAILRYRLWGIDILINRTLVYLPLTAIIAGLFAAAIAVFQRLFLGLTGSTSLLATVLTTLVVVALFTPLKERLQGLVDRRFKESSDAGNRLHGFEEQVRKRMSAVDAGPITRRLLDDAVAAFEAKGGAAYLDQGGELRLIQTTGEWTGESKMSAAIEFGGQRFGAVELGARSRARPYTDRDRETLERVAGVVAEAIAEDAGIVASPSLEAQPTQLSSS
jgi:hypothetical protein